MGADSGTPERAALAVLVTLPHRHQATLRGFCAFGHPSTHQETRPDASYSGGSDLKLSLLALNLLGAPKLHFWKVPPLAVFVTLPHRHQATPRGFCAFGHPSTHQETRPDASYSRGSDLNIQCLTFIQLGAGAPKLDF